MNGRNIPVPGTIATFTWQGTGLLRLFGAKWEIVGMECKENGGGDWMVTFQHKTMFTSPAVNVACRRKDGLNDEILRLVESWLVGLGDERLNAVVKNMYLIEQD